MLSFKEFIQEKRKNPELNPKVSAYDYLLPYKDRDDIYITFIDIPKVGVNPGTDFNTPAGVYTYPLKELWKEYDIDKYKSFEKSKIPFATHRLYIGVIQGKKVTELSEYTKKDLKKDIDKLRDLYPNVSISEWLDISRQASKIKTPGGIFFYLTKLMADDISKDNKRKSTWQWTEILRKLGYKSFSDKKSQGIIHPNEPLQTVFFEPKSYRVIEIIDNKDYNQDIENLFEKYSWLKGNLIITKSTKIKQVGKEFYIKFARWKKGTWRGDENLYFIDSNWKDGVCENGNFNKNTWQNGSWNDGVWQNGSWNDGVWQNGEWFNGVWHNGIWKNGTFKLGTWHNGIWEGGIFESGVWRNGNWQYGHWEGGTWYKGTWHNGIWKNGNWYEGTWNRGIWEDGEWYDGLWEDGHWKNGTWIDGTWIDGIWSNGTWEGGTWKNGIWENGKWLGGYDKDGNYHTEGNSPDTWEE